MNEHGNWQVGDGRPIQRCLLKDSGTTAPLIPRFIQRWYISQLTVRERVTLWRGEKCVMATTTLPQNWLSVRDLCKNIFKADSDNGQYNGSIVLEGTWTVAVGDLEATDSYRLSHITALTILRELLHGMAWRNLLHTPNSPTALWTCQRKPSSKPMLLWPHPFLSLPSGYAHQYTQTHGTPFTPPHKANPPQLPAHFRVNVDDAPNPLFGDTAIPVLLHTDPHAHLSLQQHPMSSCSFV